MAAALVRQRRTPPPRWRAVVAAVLLAAATVAPPVVPPFPPLAAASPTLTKATPGELTVTSVGAPTGNDEGRSVAVDAYGNVYVLAVTASRYGSADVAGLDGPDTDVLLVKLSSSGRLLWRRRTGSPADDRPVGMVLTGGRLVVVGQTYGDVTGGGEGAAAAAASRTTASSFVLCYDADSSRRVWARQWVSPTTGGHHSWNAVTAGSGGEVWVAGHSGAGLYASPADTAAAAAASGGGGTTRAPTVAVVVARLDSATGATLQAGSVAHPGGADASAVGVAVTPDGVVVAAQTRSAVGGAAGGPAVPVEDLLLVRLALDDRLSSSAGSGGGDYPPALRSSGVRVVATASRHYVRGLVPGPPDSGLVYVVGSEHRSEVTAHDVSVRSYTTAGLEDGPLTLVHDTAAGGGRAGRDGGDETATSVAVLPGGRLVVGGAVKAVGGPTGGTAVVTPAVWVVDPDTGGLVRFTTAAAAAGASGWAEVTAVAIDGDGDVIVAGYVNAGRETDVLAGLLGLPAAVKAPTAAGGGRLPGATGGGSGGGGGGAGAPAAGSLFVSGTDGLGSGDRDDLSAGGGGTSPATARAYRVAVWAAVGAAGLLGVAALASCVIKVRRDRVYAPAPGGLAKMPGGAGMLSPKGGRPGGRRAYRELYDRVDVD
ncbi:hypothetical protein I4F81_001956 [Pyropia yezoensis]|uniref:Uncharacterized protein n=1 Tax=Pyropia yezoensis TaxID=2788 RepID=A0ACC3BNP7_PYRYE|nr:hypothetical protein I4F81_001956 [Neopyropia yezoensis]